MGIPILQYSNCRCDKNIGIDDKHFGKPVIAIGIYITAASLYFLVTICADTFRNYIRNRTWYPSKYFSINAISITLLAIAIKIPTDLTMSMPRPVDQLSKLAGSVLICTFMAVSIPSLGTMGNSEIISNVAALTVLVVTVLIDIGIQLDTGAICTLHYEHGVVMVVMLVLLAFVVSTSVIVNTTKKLLEREFKTRSDELSVEIQDAHGGMHADRIKEHIAKYWLLAHTSNPQFVIGRTPTCIASATLCSIAAAILIEALLLLIPLGDENLEDGLCSGESDYKETVWAVFITQSLIVVVGTIGPTSRCIWWSRKGFKYVFKNSVAVEEYWVKSLKELKDAPLRFHPKRRWWRKITRFLWCISLTALLILQTRVVQLSKLIRLISIIPIGLVQKWMPNCIIGFLVLMLPALVLHLFRKVEGTGYVFVGNLLGLACVPILLCLCCLELIKFIRNRRRTRLDPGPSDGTAYVLHLEGENDFVDFIMKSGRRDSEAWIKNAKKRKNAKLVELINQSTHLHGFNRVTNFDTRLSSSSPESIQYCWALPVVTLACIAVALPGVDQASLEDLLEAVHEGLKFVRLVDKNLDDRGLENMMVAAEFVLEGVDLYKKWFDVDLLRLKIEEDGSKIVGELGRIASYCLVEFDTSMEREPIQCKPLERPPKILAADCLLRICLTILSNYDNYGTNQSLFEWLKATVSDILGACLTNLPEVIHMKCSSTSIEVREESVRNAALLFGEVEDLLRFLYDPTKASKYSERKKYIDQWQSRDSIEAPPSDSVTVAINCEGNQ